MITTQAPSEELSDGCQLSVFTNPWVKILGERQAFCLQAPSQTVRFQGPRARACLMLVDSLYKTMSYQLVSHFINIALSVKMSSLFFSPHLEGEQIKCRRVLFIFWSSKHLAHHSVNICKRQQWRMKLSTHISACVNTVGVMPFITLKSHVNVTRGQAW